MEHKQLGNQSVRDFLYVIFKRKYQILIFFLVTVAVVTVGTLMVDPTYEATSQILIKIGRENIYVPASGDARPVMQTDRDEQINSEIELLRSRYLAEKVIDDIGPQTLYPPATEDKPSETESVNPAQRKRYWRERAINKFGDALSVSRVTKSNVIGITFQHSDPKMVATVINRLIEYYLDRHLEVHKNPQSYDFFKAQAGKLKTDLEESENALKRFKENNRITDFQQELALLLQRQAQLKTDYDQTLSQQAETRNRISELQKQMAATPKTVAQGEETTTNYQVAQNLGARLVTLELKEQELLSKYTERSRLVQNVREELRVVRDKLAEIENQQITKRNVGINTVYQQLQADYLKNEVQLKALDAKSQIQLAQLEDYARRIEKLNRSEAELSQLQTQLATAQKSYRVYLDRLEESRISEAMDLEKISNVSVMQPAEIPNRPVSPKKRLNIALAILLGCFGGVGLAFIREAMDTRLERPDQIESYLKLPVLTTIQE